MAKRKTSPSESDSDASDSVSKRRRLEEDMLAKEKEFEAKNIPKAEAEIKAREAHQGRASECGIIQSLEMHQFMCHPRLSFTFGPQVNFIIGHNGSGKSAVLSAITIALGGKSIVTGRGTSLKSFIREGQRQAEVTIVLKNEGDGAFKHDLYGDSIAITRRLSKDGSSWYKIKSKEGRVVSSKKEELSAICKHFSIQIDNPLSVLTQDSARQFFSKSDAEDRYLFFLRGTQLKQLIEDYEVCWQHVIKTSKIIEKKSQVIPVLEEEEQKATKRNEVAKKMSQMRITVGELKQELAWSHVKGKKEELEAKLEEAATVKHRRTKIQKNVDDAQANLDVVSQRIANLEAGLAALAGSEALNEARDKAQSGLEENNTHLREFQDSIKTMNDDLQSNTGEIQLLTVQIAEEAAKMQADKRAEREERHLKVEELAKSIDEQNELLEKVTGDQTSKRDQLADLNRQMNELTSEKGKHEQDARECYEQLLRIDQQAGNRLNAFGKNLENVHRRVKECRWHGRVPIGPLGSFVNLQDQQWAQVMRIQLGALARAFAITNHQDKDQLKKILSESNNSDVQVVVAEVDMFDYSSGEPPSDVLTVLRAVTFTDEYVKRIFITQSRIERVLLAPRRVDGEQAARAISGGGTAWTGVDQYRVIVYNDGGASSSPMARLSRNDPRMQLFMDNNLQNERKRWKENGQKATEKLEEVSKSIDEMTIKLNECDMELRRLNPQIRPVHNRLHELIRQREVLIEQDKEDVPIDIAALQGAKQDLENANESINVQFTHAMEQMTDLENRRQPLKDMLEVLVNQLDSLEREKASFQGQINETTVEHVGASHNLEHWKNKLRDEQGKALALEEVVSNIQDEYEEWTKKAEELCDGNRVAEPREADEVRRLIESNEEALKRQEQSQGASAEEIKHAMLVARRDLDVARKEIRDAKLYNKLLDMSLNERSARWHYFRMYSALKTKILFGQNLEKREYVGKALFHHMDQMLELVVRTRDQKELKQRPNVKKSKVDTKSLSGGEKSFTTLSLLLALWEVIECPIRCLDEFDVFMDAANRRTSMEMMINFASSTNAQYILITPQDMSAVQLNPSVRVHRMRDPERSQRTLPF